MYKAIIIEDNAPVAEIDREYLEKCGGFEIVAILKDGAEALEYLKNNSVDLAILDVYMPKMDGMHLLHKLRTLHNPVSVIMITAANDLRIIENSLNSGIIDYIIKPFSFERFASAIEKFKKRAGFMEEHKEERLTQTKLDKLLDTSLESSKNAPLEKGLNKKTLDTVFSWMTDHPNERVTCETMSGQLNLSKVTIRRYLNYLIENGKVKSTVDYETGGRPSIIYQLK
ncbi:response regulator [Oribacterium sp. WCC10]|uniref:response regulator n=1 Tax=Oribacterium sp. WCC10 TaxID=1855343 RepID=UPI0008EA527D|nr:response regulator [Oribacterium sp. WCC10]SFG13892.1 two-component system, CitB family, response regulator MalR [Oribacterium sp. WCC10]